MKVKKAIKLLIQGRTCRECGCTSTHACNTSTGPCKWVEKDLCSACQ